MAAVIEDADKKKEFVKLLFNNSEIMARMFTTLIPAIIGFTVQQSGSDCEKILEIIKGLRTEEGHFEKLLEFREFLDKNCNIKEHIEVYLMTALSRLSEVTEAENGE